MTEAEVVSELGRLDELVMYDGAAFELAGVDGAAHSVSLRLRLDGVECLDCVMPRDFLEQLALNVLKPSLPDLVRVEIDDPREHAGFEAAPSH